jgi:very-short-patch-repair endonuclease
MRAWEPKAPVAASIWVPEHVKSTGDGEIARVAAAQRGFITREQLLEAGFTRSAILNRIRRGQLLRHRLYRGVYAVGRPATEPFAEETAAVLYFCGRAIPSHRSGMALWGLIDAVPVEPTLTIVGFDARSRAGLMLHRVPDLDRRDLRLHRGLPVTSPARTLLDFASEASDHELEEGLARAQRRSLVRASQIREAAERAPGRKGVKRLLALLEPDRTGVRFTRSRAERELLALIRAAQLPSPIVNEPVLGYVADFLWPEQKLIIEFDSHEFHADRVAFDGDRRRDQRLIAAGWVVIRVTWEHLIHEPYALVARIAQALALRSPVLAA